MKTTSRRWLAIVGACLAGAALGELINEILGAIGSFIGSNNLLLNPRGNGTIWLSGSPYIWLTGAALGAGVGAIVAALIHDCPVSARRDARVMGITRQDHREAMAQGGGASRFDE
jgi:hypothetical protein